MMPRKTASGQNQSVKDFNKSRVGLLVRAIGQLLCIEYQLRISNINEHNSHGATRAV